MDVRLHHVLDGQAALARELQVLLDIHLGVDHRGDAGGIVADEVAGVAQLTGQ